jgi:SAM-dependent methyltransferase
VSFTDPAFVEIYEKIDGSRTIDLEFYRGISKSAKGPVLEAGCGSGRILLPLQKEGVDISGFDPSEAMLDVLRSRASANGLNPKVWQGDFESVQGNYAAVICPFNSLMHLLTQEQEVAAFRQVYRSLEPDGLFAFDIANPNAFDIYDERRQFDSTYTDVKTEESVEIWRWFEHDLLTQTAKYHREFITKKTTLNSVLEFRWTYPSEISLLLQLAGFSSWDVLGDFDRGPFLADSESQIWIARK